MILNIVLAVIALVGIGLSIWRWKQMRGWKRAFYYGELVIAYNNRVLSRVKLVELYQWCWELSGDKRWKGETFFKRNKVSLSITRPLNPPSRIEAAMAHWKGRKTREQRKAELVKNSKVVEHGK